MPSRGGIAWYHAPQYSCAANACSHCYEGRHPMASRRYNKSTTPDPTKRYATDLTDQEFDLVAPYVAQKAGSGKKRTVNIREILNAIFYRIRTGCQWRMLPKDFPTWNHVWYYYHTWRDDGRL